MVMTIDGGEGKSLNKFHLLLFKTDNIFGKNIKLCLIMFLIFNFESIIIYYGSTACLWCCISHNTCIRALALIVIWWDQLKYENPHFISAYKQNC